MTSVAYFISAALLCLPAASAQETPNNIVVAGSVFCDQCKDGRQDSYDYALEGMKVKVRCLSLDKTIITETAVYSTSSGEYVARFNNSRASLCEAKLLGSRKNSLTCGEIEAGPHYKRARLLTRYIDTDLYLVSPLLSQPAQPSDPHCQKPRLPMWETPLDLPYRKPTACSHEMWARKDNICHWNMVRPSTKVAEAFGENAARRYGTDLNLWQGLQGKEEPYEKLLRETIATLLNAYHTTDFPYTPKDVIYRMNFTLADNQDQVIRTTMGFQNINNQYGYGCDLTPCKK